MNIYEHTRIDEWLDIHDPECDVRHTIRGCNKLSELLYWLPKNLHVYLECDNINCKFHWSVYKSVFFIDENSVIANLTCPSCFKRFVTARWVYFPSQLFGQWKCTYKWMYDVNTLTRTFYGNQEDFFPIPGFTPAQIENYMFGIILHIHQQYIIRTEGNHFV